MRKCLHGHRVGDKYTPLYIRWMEMIKRCYYENGKDYRYYGGRGIQVYEPWRTFTVWLLLLVVS